MNMEKEGEGYREHQRLEFVVMGLDGVSRREVQVSREQRGPRRVLDLLEDYSHDGEEEEEEHKGCSVFSSRGDGSQRRSWRLVHGGRPLPPEKSLFDFWREEDNHDEEKRNKSSIIFLYATPIWIGGHIEPPRKRARILEQDADPIPPLRDPDDPDDDSDDSDDVSYYSDDGTIIDETLIIGYMIRPPPPLLSSRDDAIEAGEEEGGTCQLQILDGQYYFTYEQEQAVEGEDGFSIVMGDGGGVEEGPQDPQGPPNMATIRIFPDFSIGEFEYFIGELLLNWSIDEEEMLPVYNTGITFPQNAEFVRSQQECSQFPYQFKIINEHEEELIVNIRWWNNQLSSVKVCGNSVSTLSSPSFPGQAPFVTNRTVEGECGVDFDLFTL